MKILISPLQNPSRVTAEIPEIRQMTSLRLVDPNDNIASNAVNPDPRNIHLKIILEATSSTMR